ncbi:15227_t:CDS:1, partial [Funneliformis mosseae]
MRTYNRHRKNQQEYLDVGEINISYQEQNLEDIQYQDIYQQENKYQQENQLNIIDKDSDIR